MSTAAIATEDDLKAQEAVKAKWASLSPKHRRQHKQFCLEYIVDFNGRQAAIRAGYSKKGAAQTAFRLLTYVHIQARISELTYERQQRARKNGDDVLRELEHIGFSRLTNIITFNESGAAFVKNSDEIADDDVAAIESIQVTEDSISMGTVGEGEGKKELSKMVLKTKVKLHPKIPALKELAKHHGVCQSALEKVFDGEGLPQGITINFVSSAKGDK